jgi:ribosomal protein S18 acetylase RimI-like enzyme
MTFREMEPRDIAACIEVRTSVKENHYSRAALAAAGITEESVAALLGSTHQGWVCEVDGRLAGFSMANRSTGEFWVVAVRPEYEGRGIGRKLTASATQWLQTCGCPEIWLWTSPDITSRAYAMYRKAGWRDCGVKDGQRIMRWESGLIRGGKAENAG